MQRQAISHFYGIVGTSWPWIGEEAAVAAITFSAVHQAEHVREQPKTVLAAFRAMLDAFVGNRMRRAAADAEHVRPRQPLGTPSPSIKAR
jgi:hypothetical protein